MNWKTLSLSAGLTLSTVLLGYASVPASAQTTAGSSGGAMMEHSGTSNCDATAKGDAMSGGAMAQGDAMSGGAMSGGAMAQGDAMKSPTGDAMGGGAMAQGDAMSGAMASGAMSECNAPSATTPNSTGSR